jgi:hypothetical protein
MKRQMDMIVVNIVRVGSLAEDPAHAVQDEQSTHRPHRVLCERPSENMLVKNMISCLMTGYYLIKRRLA